MGHLGRRLISLALLAVGAATLAGCGSTAHVTRTITRTVSTAPASPPTTTSRSTTATTTAHAQTAPAASAIAGLSPRAIVVASAEALRHSGGYAMGADLRQGGRRTVIHLTTTGARTFFATLAVAGTVSDVIGLPGAAFLRGDLAFWRAQAGRSRAARTRAPTLANRWLRLSSAGARSVTGSLGTLASGTFARCLVEDHGTLSIAGRTRIGGTRAILVADAGNAPGATPSTLAVAATGRPYPLRYVANGPTRTGGRIDVCNTGRGGGATGTIALSQFGQIPPIQPPAGTGQAPGGANA